MEEEIRVRDARPADAEGLARVHADVARYYADQGPRYFDGGELMLVAEIDGEVVGALAGRLVQPTNADDPSQSETRLRIDYLATAADRRRSGIGTQLVEAAERWGRGAGATIAETTAFRGSALSIPFWEDRMGYEEQPMSLEKRLDRPARTPTSQA
jgi:GNAT superfamily N-acetyltransferase